MDPRFECSCKRNCLKNNNEIIKLSHSKGQTISICHEIVKILCFQADVKISAVTNLSPSQISNAFLVIIFKISNSMNNFYEGIFIKFTKKVAKPQKMKSRLKKLVIYGVKLFSWGSTFESLNSQNINASINALSLDIVFF